MPLKRVSKPFQNKPAQLRMLGEHVIKVLEFFGAGVESISTDRQLERVAMVFLAVADVKSMKEVKNAKDQSDVDTHAPKTRDIIQYINENFDENISSGSYDDIRRKSLHNLVLGKIVLNSNPNSATNSPNRGYVLNPEYAELFRESIGLSKQWKAKVQNVLEKVTSIAEKLEAKRDMIKVPILNRETLQLSLGEHNELQKVIIEEFLPRYGYGAEILYVGDTKKKDLIKEEKKLRELKFFDLSHDRLPDIIAYSEHRNWLYIIEAVHSTGAINQGKLVLFQELTKDCLADIIYVTAFLTRDKFRQFAKDIAWETEVWIAENPDHMIHFNGDKFLGPY